MKWHRVWFLAADCEVDRLRELGPAGWGPWWIIGQTMDDRSIVVAYIPKDYEWTHVKELCPSAQCEGWDEREKVTFTDRFLKPDGWDTENDCWIERVDRVQGLPNSYVWAGGTMNEAITWLVDEAHNTAKEKGFWNDFIDRPIDRIARAGLVASEVGEWIEAIRKPRDSELLKGESNELEEIADIFIRCADYVGAQDKGPELAQIIMKKLVYNRSRPRLHGKKA